MIRLRPRDVAQVVDHITHGLYRLLWRGRP